jgi:putative glutamine amidotransferase
LKEVKMSRPRIAILGRIAESTSVTRYAGIVTAARLAEAVWAAGAEPLTLLPVANANLGERLAGIGAVLMPGGGDVNPERYGQQPTTDRIYGVVDLQDQTDLEIFDFATANALPLLAICRGFQIINVARGGTLVQDMPTPHTHHVETITVHEPEVLGLPGNTVEASCYHHQCVDRLGSGLEVIARAAAGHAEAFKVESSAWITGVQWHPEDNFDSRPENLAIFEKLVLEASKRA